MWREYAAADLRYGTADATVVSIELITVFGAGPICFWILGQLVRDDPARHFWIVVLTTAELYGAWMAFGPEWLTGSPNLVTSNPLFLWVYLFVRRSSPLSEDFCSIRASVHEHDASYPFLAKFPLANVCSWVIVPLGLMVNSYNEIAKSLRATQASSKAKKA